MAEIYLGRVRGTAGFHKLVAVKRVLPYIAADSGFVEMFLAEARLAATLHHPNIGDVFDVGESRGSYFFAMEFIHGQDLRAIRAEALDRRQKLPLEIVLAAISGIAQALAYTHSRTGLNNMPLGLVHRDVSPSNMLVSYEGAVKLVDFGIARAESSSAATRTRTGQLKGKIPYMSPEQCRARNIDGRADLFSLGTCLYELLTNERPFDGKGDFDTLERIVHGTMRPIEELRADLPPGLVAIVMRMLANKRGARYQTAEALLQDIEALQSELGLFASATMLGKYMRELFPTESQEVPHADDDGEAPTLTPDEPEISIESPGARGDTIDIADPAPSPRATSSVSGFAIEVSTADIEPAPEFRVSFRAPTDASPRVSAQYETEPMQAMPAIEDNSRESTFADMFPPFDPIATRSAQMLAAIDPDLVDDRDLSLGTINELLQKAVTAAESNDLESAIIATEVILSADRAVPGVLDLLAKNYPFMTEIFETFLGDRTRMLALLEQTEDIANLPLDRRALFLLSLIEGSMTANELIEKTDMPIVEVYRHLSQLVLRRVVTLV